MIIPETWIKHIQNWQDSDLTQKDYCQQHDLNYNSFVYWRGQIKQSKKSADFLARPKQVLPAFAAIASQVNTAPANKDNKHRCIELSLPHGITLKISLPC